jgi:hypothetical protein
MQFVTLAPRTATKLFWSAVAGLAALLLLTAAEGNPVLLAACFLLIVVSVFPLYIWLLGRSHGLPIWPAFSAYSGLLAAMPVIQSSKSLSVYSDDATLGGLLVMGGFLVVGSVVWVVMTSRVPPPPKNVLMLEPGSAMNALFWCLVVGLLFQVNSFAGWIAFPGNTMQIARGVAGGLSYLGIFALAYFHGAGLLSKLQSGAFYALFAALLLVALTSLMLASIIPFVALALIGFTLGAGRVPWLVLVAGFLVAALLHTGKYQMRQIYFDADGVRGKAASGLGDLPGLYTEWFGYGFEELGGFGSAVRGAGREDGPSTVFERAGNLHMLLLVLEKTPKEVPYLNGLTYEPIPAMLIPRFLTPEKTISHVGNVMLSINYGLLDEEGARRTSIGWSLVAEAYANFGYIGIIILAVLLAALYSEVTRLSSRVPITSFRFIAGLIVLAGVTNENSLGVFITMQFQGVAGVALASIVLMRKQPNPLAEGAGADRQMPPLIREKAAEGAKSKTNGAVTPQLAADGGLVRAMPTKVPKRVARWMPRRVRAAVVAAARGAEQTGGSEQGTAEAQGGAGVTRERPRQLAVPYQNYRRYRG